MLYFGIRNKAFCLVTQFKPNEKANPVKAGGAKLTGLRRECYGGRAPKGECIMERFIRVLLVVFIMAVVGIVPVFSDGTGSIAFNGVKLDKPESTQIEGYITISGSTAEEKIKLLVTGAEKQIWYEVRLIDGRFAEEIWFDSLGEYSIMVMVNEYGRKYSKGPAYTVVNTKKLDKYLAPAKHIESNSAEIAQKALDITAGCANDLDRARAIYQWILDNIEYDYTKLAKHNKGEYDNQYGALNTLATNSGVCYDYATLFAALARAVGIQTKVVEGDLNSGALKGFHAWNEVYIQELERWISIDVAMSDTTGENTFDFADYDESYTAQIYK